MTLRTLLLALPALAGCLDGAPHDNPLDSGSDLYRDAGTVAGRVTGIYPPFEGRADVRVHLVPLGAVPLGAGGAERVVRTAADGAFRAEGLPGGLYEVRAERDGFRAKADTITVAAGAVAQADFRLDALPVVVSQAARTVHIDRWPPLSPVFQLEVEVAATDPDRAADVDGAALVAEGIAFREPLVETAPGRFAGALDAARLPGGRVQSLLGRALRVEVTDRAGNTALGPPLALVRVVEQTPLTFRPQITDAPPPNPPVLEWRPSDLPFAFTYRVEVFLEDGAGVPNLVYTRGGVEASATSHALPAALPIGDYSWAVWTVDEAGNRSRSKPAGFRVLQ